MRGRHSGAIVKVTYTAALQGHGGRLVRIAEINRAVLTMNELWFLVIPDNQTPLRQLPHSLYGRELRVGGGDSGGRIRTGGSVFLRASVSKLRSFAGLTGFLKMAPSSPSNRLRLMM